MTVHPAQPGSSVVPAARRRWRAEVMRRVDAALFGFAGLAAIWLAVLLLTQGIRPGWPLLLLVAFWVVFTYLLLPRLHRILTYVYVPGYFIGRTRTSDGLLGDPVNLALRGEQGQILRVMTDAGWTRADDLSLASSRAMITATLRRRSYPEAPVSPLLLFDRQQDFAFQQEVGGTTSQRHHVRFWACPPGWMLPGGYAVDWLAAGTFDRRVGLSLFTLQITHKIEANTDLERDFVVSTVTTATPSVTVDVIKDFSTGYHARNGGGDLIRTDGDLPILDVSAVSASDVPPEETDSRDKRPAQTTFGAAVVVARGLIAVAYIVLLLTGLEAGEVAEATDDSGTSSAIVVAVAAVALGIVALVEVGLGLATFFGRNWARLLVMAYAVLTTVISFVADLSGSTLVGLAELPAVATGILVLLALSSHRARDFAIRGHAQPKRLAGEPGDQARF